MPRFFTKAPSEHVMARAELCQASPSIYSLKAQVSTPDPERYDKRSASKTKFTVGLSVSHQTASNFENFVGGGIQAFLFRRRSRLTASTQLSWILEQAMGIELQILSFNTERRYVRSQVNWRPKLCVLVRLAFALEPFQSFRRFLVNNTVNLSGWCVHHSLEVLPE